MMLFIRDLNKLYGMEVYRVENRMFEWKLLYGLQSDLMMTVNLWNSSILILLTPVWLVLMLQYFSNPVFMTESILVISWTALL